MPAATKDIRRRIRSVGNTRKITRAMELVASAKMRRVAQVVTSGRSYTDQAWEMLIHLSHRTDSELHPLLQDRPVVRRVAIVLMTTNRGQVGALNANIGLTLKRHVRELATKDIAADIILFGTKGRPVARELGLDIVAEFDKPDIVNSIAPIKPITRLLVRRFLKQEIDRCVVVYPDFVSSLLQRPRVRQVLPLAESAMHQPEGIMSDKENRPLAAEAANEERQFEYAFEPNPDDVLEFLLPRLVTAQLYRAVLETNASEQAARMMAMRNATEAAGDIIDELTLAFNQARQASITQDLAEISAGRAALESA